jgi:hypothetical protein
MIVFYVLIVQESNLLYVMTLSRVMQISWGQEAYN